MQYKNFAHAHSGLVVNAFGFFGKNLVRASQKRKNLSFLDFEAYFVNSPQFSVTAAEPLNRHNRIFHNAILHSICLLLA
jgi:hypothetical protein